MYTQISGYLLPHKENHDSDIGSLTRSDKINKINDWLILIPWIKKENKSSGVGL